VKFENVYFINGTAYAGKSTMVKLLAEKYDGIACEENYQDRLLENLDTKEFPNLTYTRDLQDWGEFVRRTPDEYEAWVNGVTKECTVLEIESEQNRCAMACQGCGAVFLLFLKKAVDYFLKSIYC